MNRYLSELPQLFWVLCQFQQLGVKGHWGSVFSGDCKTDGCHVLFPQIQNGEQKAYVLKNKQLTGPTKGVIYLEIDVIFNAVSLNFGFFVLLKSFSFMKAFVLICREFLSFLILSKPWCILQIPLLPLAETPHFCTLLHLLLMCTQAWVSVPYGHGLLTLNFYNCSKWHVYW